MEKYPCVASFNMQKGKFLETPEQCEHDHDIGTVELTKLIRTQFETVKVERMKTIMVQRTYNLFNWGLKNAEEPTGKEMRRIDLMNLACKTCSTPYDLRMGDGCVKCEIEEMMSIFDWFDTMYHLVKMHTPWIEKISKTEVDWPASKDSVRTNNAEEIAMLRVWRKLKANDDFFLFEIMENIDMQPPQTLLELPPVTTPLPVEYNDPLDFLQ